MGNASEQGQGTNSDKDAQGTHTCTSARMLVRARDNAAHDRTHARSPSSPPPLRAPHRHRCARARAHARALVRAHDQHTRAHRAAQVMVTYR